MRELEKPYYKGNKRRMQPISGKETLWKFVADVGLGNKISKTGKLVAKNANRSLKKRGRQKSKELIEHILSNG